MLTFLVVFFRSSPFYGRFITTIVLFTHLFPSLPLSSGHHNQYGVIGRIHWRQQQHFNQLFSHTHIYINTTQSNHRFFLSHQPSHPFVFAQLLH